jgi:PAS domain S-box-containing protein
LGGLLFTGVVCYNLATIGEAEDQGRFSSDVHEIIRGIQGRMETYEALLRSTAALFAASDSVSETDFKNFVARLGVREHYPGIQGIGFSIRVKPSEKDTLVKNRRSALPDFKIWPESAREEYHSIIYLEPQDERNKAAMGYDMFTEPVRRAAMERARDTGQAAASGAVTLVQEIDPNQKQAGFLVFLPVYEKGKDISTVERRREALLGFVYSPYRADDFLANVGPSKSSNVDYQIFDGPPSPNAHLLHDSTRFTGAQPAGYAPHFSATSTVPLAGQTWGLSFTSRPSFDETSNKGFVLHALAGGLLLSLLFFVVTHSQLRSRAAAEHAAATLRASEATVRKTLADRERAEEALKESEERYRELVENANDVVYTVDLDSRVNSVNQAGELLTGYPREELIGMDFSQLLTLSSADVARHMLDLKKAGEQRSNYEVDLKTKSGKVITLEISSRLILKDGRPIGAQGIARDITMRRQAEEALREADQRALTEYERLLERIASFSQALGTAHNLEAIFRSLRDFAVVSAPCDGLFVSLYDPVRDVRTACYGYGDGEEFDVSGLPPMPVNTMGPNSRAVRSGQVIITDDYMNTQRGHPSVTVGPDNGLRPQSSMAVPMAVMGRIIGTIEIQSYEKAAYRDEHVTAMRMAANLTAVAVENVRLLERESTARATAEESNRLKDEFLATVSHELRTPLTAILGWSRMLETGSLEEDAITRAIETIRRNATAQAQIIDDILDVSRIITGNLSFDLHPIEVAPIIESAINVVRPTADAKGIHIHVDLGSRPAVISADANRLQQVIWNLLSNAVKFTPVSGRVTVELRQVESRAELSVTDSGSGIDPSFLPFVFDRFRQADSTTTRQHGGLGLGLAIARHLVEIHGGSIHAESQGGGQGSKFTVSLPLVASFAKANEDDATSRAKPKYADASLEGLHILLVDDDRDTLELLKMALSQCLARVTEVTSASEALAAIRLATPDVLISDIAMPDSDGYELIQQVRECGLSDMPAIAITAYAKEEDRLRALSSGFQYYVTKPVEISELITAIADAAHFKHTTEGTRS